MGLHSLRNEVCFPLKQAHFVSNEISENYLSDVGLARNWKLYLFCIEAPLIVKKKNAYVTLWTTSNTAERRMEPSDPGG